MATEAANEATRIAAIKEAFDRAIGKASQPVETQVQVGISAELERLLKQCDGQSRSIPARETGPLLLTEAIPSSSNAPSDIPATGRASPFEDIPPNWGVASLRHQILFVG